jgi:hypothetical protein
MRRPDRIKRPGSRQAPTSKALASCTPALFRACCALTIHSSRRRFAARLNSGVRHTPPMVASENSDGIARVEAEMPPLDLDMTLRCKRELGHLLGVHGPHEPCGKMIADGLVRLVDKCGLEYVAARAMLLEFLAHGTVMHYHRAQDHFESCVQALHRGINYLERLRALGYSNNGVPLVARPRDLEVIREVTKSAVRQFRDFLEHIEDDIIQGRVPSDSNAFIHLGWSSASINGATLAYADVARWVSQLHEIAAPLSVVTLTVSTPDAAGGAGSGA